MQVCGRAWNKTLESGFGGPEVERSLQRVAPSQKIRTDDLKVLYVSESLWLPVCDQQKEKLDLMTSRDRRSSGKCNPVENLCLGWNGVPNLTLGSFHCGLFLFVGHLSLLLHEHTFIPLLLFPESKLVLSHT
uniref:Uncharacterized protein n=2 Tax=Rousettus aegyptiacus TaxID=9407 RepID=A0A7J8BEU6_ROUAE|nr:hypothetical protein HJG63_009880 [Rousettus aegyptiacus]